jgi:hypothetical protein
MTFQAVLELLDATIYNKRRMSHDPDISYAFVCDLMSDALMLLKQLPHHVGTCGALVTGLATNQAIRTAEILDLDTIIFVRGKVPAASVIALADDLDIRLIGTNLTMYKTSGLLFTHGVKSYESVLEELA